MSKPLSVDIELVFLSLSRAALRTGMPGNGWVGAASVSRWRNQERHHDDARAKALRGDRGSGRNKETILTMLRERDNVGKVFGRLAAYQHAVPTHASNQVHLGAPICLQLRIRQPARITLASADPVD
jgi:hypothetical protein